MYQMRTENWFSRLVIALGKICQNIPIFHVLAFT